MKILAVVASPRGRGKTYGTVRQVEETLKRYEPDMEFEYMILKDTDLQTCRGCYLCLDRGEQFCPIKDERAVIEHKMLACDGFIFASPVYVYNMSWMAKNFFDRYAYICHRPRFHNKKAMVVSTTGAVGLQLTLLMLVLSLKFWGFDVAGRLGVRIPPMRKEELDLDTEYKNEKAMEKAAMKFYRAVKNDQKRKPGILNMMIFSLQKAAFGNAVRDSADYIYWKEKGWLKPEAKYYYETHIGPVKSFISSILTAIFLMPAIKKPKADGTAYKA